MFKINVMHYFISFAFWLNLSIIHFYDQKKVLFISFPIWLVYLLGGWNGSGTHHLLHFNLDPSAVQHIAQLGLAMGNMGQCPNLPNIIFSL